MPALKKIEVNKKGKVRQSRIYYFRELRERKLGLKKYKSYVKNQSSQSHSRDRWR